MTAGVVALALYLPLLAAACALVWRRPVRALYAFVVGLAAHNAVMAGLHSAGVQGLALTAVQAWKEVLLTTAAASVALTAVRARRLPFRPAPVDGLALAFGALVVVYTLVPQEVLGGEAGREALLLGARHALLPVLAYLVGRSLAVGAEELRRLGWTILGTAAVVAAIGLVDEYTISVEWWRDSGVPEYFREELGFDYKGPGGMPENFAFNSDEGLSRRLISTFLSPLASAFTFAVALLLVAAGGPLRRPLAWALAAVVATGLLFTFSRSSLLALAAGLVVLAVARRRAWPLGAAAATVAVGVLFALVFTSVAPATHFFPDELEEQRRIALERGDVPDAELSLDEPSVRSHLTSLREGVRTVLEHPQGYGPGNAGAVARRTGTELKAGESNYTELGVETGIAGALLFLAWGVALLVGLVRAARHADPARRWAAAGLAAALATVLVLGVQTDAVGVPWLAYCVWWLSGSLVLPAAAALPATASARTRWSSATENGLTR